MRTSILMLVALSACVDPAASRDRDGDGFFTSELDGDDCDDNNPDVNPSASEVCGNGLDDNCDGNTDDDGIGNRSWFVDSDQDGYPGDTEFVGCSAPSGTFADLSRGIDCDDTRSDSYPGAPEVWYDGVDQDCAGDNDNDADGDGFDAVSAGGDDCEDTEMTVNPAGVEVCNNGWDDDCDGSPNQCAYTGTVDFESVASTIFTTAAQEHWLGHFNTDSEPDVLLAVGGSADEPRNRFELYFGPLNAAETTPDAIIYRPDAPLWGEDDRLVEGDFNGDGMTDIVVFGVYPGETNASVRVFLSPFDTTDLDGVDADAKIDLSGTPFPDAEVITGAMSAVPRPGTPADDLLWNGRTGVFSPASVLFDGDTLSGGIDFAGREQISMPLLTWLPARLDPSRPNYVITAQTFGQGALDRTVGSLTLPTSTQPAVFTAGSPDPAMVSNNFDQLLKEARFDPDNDGVPELFIGGYTQIARSGINETGWLGARRTSFNGPTLEPFSLVATPGVTPVPDTRGAIATLAVCDITGDDGFEYLDSVFFGNGFIPEDQTIRWSQLGLSPTVIGSSPFVSADAFVFAATCANDGEQLFLSLSNGTTLLVPPLRQ